MNKTVKWMLVIAGSMATLLIAAVIMVALLFDLEKYRPQIEQQVAKATGRNFKLGGDLKPSIFPWVGIRLSDLHLGNPAGFEEEDFISVADFEVRVKLLPLLSRNIEVKRFVMKQPTIVLEKRKDGKGGWEGLGTTGDTPTDASNKAPEATPSSGLPIKKLQVGEFAITDGRIIWLDQAGGNRKEIEQINLTLTDVSLDQPIGMAFSAVADKKPIALNGTIGPVGEAPGKTPLPLDLVAKLVDQLDIQINGRIDPSQAPLKFDLGVTVAQFSPRRLMEALKQPLPLETADPKVLNAVVLALKVSGTPERLTIADGQLTLDDTRITFSADAREFSKPNIKADMALDRIDLDRYLPPPREGSTADSDTPAGVNAETAIDYAPLRRLKMDATIAANELKVKKARMQDISATISASNGIVRLNPFTVNLYQGRIGATGTINVQQSKPKTTLQLALNNIQSGPLIKDVMEKTLIEGGLNATIGLDFRGDAAQQIRETLNGKGDLSFRDGAIVGIDLANMVRNVKAAFGNQEALTEKPRTDFAELLMPFTITNGRFQTDASKLNSPLMRVLANGSAHLAQESLDFRVNPKFVATIKGQGDTSQRSGIMVPVIISGSFSSPKFKPDLEAMLGQQLGKELPDKEALKKALSEEELKKSLEKEAEKALEKGVQDLFKSLGSE